MTLAVTRVLAQVWLELEYAAICLNDHPELIFDLRDQECPQCGSRNWHPLAKWLQERRTSRTEELFQDLRSAISKMAHAVELATKELKG